MNAAEAREAELPAPRAVGASWGDPLSARTYSGVPQPLFAELRRTGTMVAVANADLTKPTDMFGRHLVDWRRSFHARRPRKRSLWRYLPENIELLSSRFQSLQRSLPEHDCVLQFGVGGLPSPETALVSHVEIPVRTAVTTEVFARSYGFAGLSDRSVRRAIDGERRFLERCALVWTNTTWTAALLEAEGVEPCRLRVLPPPCAGRDPGEIERSWDGCHILFIGKDWERKGGNLLVDAFRDVRRARPASTLTIVGCEPSISEPGIRVLGFLSRDVPTEARALHEAMVGATVFCMPSQWESTGLVYLEAALYGLPVVMLAGQGRDEVFASDMCLQVDRAEASVLADALVELSSFPDQLAAMGRRGRARVLASHTLPVVASRVEGWLKQAVAAWS